MKWNLRDEYANECCINIIEEEMNMGYNNAYVNDTMVVGPGQPYYAQPMMVQPQPEVVVVENNNGYAAGAAAGA